MGVKRPKREPGDENIHMECGLPYDQHGRIGKHGGTFCPDTIGAPIGREADEIRELQNPVEVDREDAIWDSLDEEGLPWSSDD